ncbi:ABC transporter ATP-binding protein [Kitasatospora sp. NPDC004615]|uniref:ABC transporter ATP-binding protein n=1 Tax=Kitasatospora sp. NPDC004615 TaxID=3364017 RepID=UPI00368A7AB8
MIDVNDLTKRYGPHTALEGLTFAARPGAVTGFLGPNGAGKTTTMRMILGLTRPDGGSALINGLPYRQLPFPARQVGALLEGGGAHRGLTARDHLRWLARSNGIAPERVGRMLDLTGLGAAAGKRVGALSLGMSQRLGLAAALLGDPPVLVLDEPVNGLDAEGIRWLRELLRTMAAEGRTVFVSSHLMAEMSMVADRLVVVDRGRLVADATLEEFLARHARAHVQVRTPEPALLAAELQRAGATVQCAADSSLQVTGLPAAEIGRLAAARGLPLDELATRTDSLEETFLALLAERNTARA